MSETTASPRPVRPTHRPPPAPHSVERRRHERHAMLAQVQLISGTEVHILSTVNISIGGMLLSTDANDEIEVARGDHVEIFLSHRTRRAHIEMTAKAKVVRVQTGETPGARKGIAVVWSNLNPAMAQQLQVLLEDLKSR